MDNFAVVPTKPAGALKDFLDYIAKLVSSDTDTSIKPEELWAEFLMMSPKIGQPFSYSEWDGGFVTHKTLEKAIAEAEKPILEGICCEGACCVDETSDDAHAWAGIAIYRPMIDMKEGLYLGVIGGNRDD